MKQPKVYVKYLNKVLEVESINFDTKVVAVYDESRNMYNYCDFDEVEFIWRGATGKYDNITLLFIQLYVKNTTKALIR